MFRNRRKRNIAILIVAFLLICTVSLIFSVHTNVRDRGRIKKGENQGEKVRTMHDKERFFDAYLFDRGIAAQKNDQFIDAPIRGAIVPHHLVPSYIIADIFARIGTQEPHTIIVLSPNHYERGESVMTGISPWDTPYGVVSVANDMVRAFEEMSIVGIDDDVLDSEHGIANLMPFISYYMPQARIVPIVLRQNMSMEQINNLAKIIAYNADTDTVVVASVDFSHYLPSKQAEEHNKAMEQVIRNRDYDQLLHMNNDYVDSPQAVATLLQSIDHMGAPSMHVLHNTNSGALFDDPFAETTSYFGIIFTK